MMYLFALFALLMQLPVEVPAAPIPVVVTPDLSAAMIVAITAAVVAILGALTTGIATVIRALHETRDTITATQQAMEENQTTQRQAGEKRDKKLDKIEVLVDGRYSEVLQELADVKKLLAQESGRASDHERATSAQLRADGQQARVDHANGLENKDKEPVEVKVVNVPLVVTADK